MKKKHLPAKDARAPIVKTSAIPTGNPLVGAVAAAVIAFLLYLPALKNGFVNWDDDATIVNNPLLARIGAQNFRDIFDLQKSSAGLGNYNPLTILSFYLEKWMTGDLSSTLIHFDNVLLHALTVFFVVRVLLAMGIGSGGAFVGGLLFGIHPMRVESVAWATERKDVLFAVFFLAALWYYLRWLRDGGERRFYGIALLLALLSCLAKVQAVALPLSMLALDYWFKRPFTAKTVLLEKAPFWALSVLFGAINVYTLGLQGATDNSITHFSLADRLCIGAWSFCVYLYKLAIPFPMLPLYNYPKQLEPWMYAAPLLFAGIAYLVWRLHRSGQRIWVFGFLFFFFNVMFLLQVQTAGQGYLADRFTYVAYFGFFAVAAFLYGRLADQPALQGKWKTGLIALGVLYAAMTVMQTGIWKNSETLWSHVIRYEGDKSGLPHWYRGQYYRSQGQYDKAMADYQHALTLEPKNAELLNSRGKTYFDMVVSGKYPKEQSGDFMKRSLDDYNASLGLADNVKPLTKAAMLINRGAAYGTINQLDKALQDFNEGLRLDPQNKMGYMNLGAVYQKMRQPEQAAQAYTKYLELDPENARVRKELEKLQKK
jgi:tetratricopeptide (TPR) repeat protein